MKLHSYYTRSEKKNNLLFVNIVCPYDMALFCRNGEKWNAEYI